MLTFTVAKEKQLERQLSDSKETVEPDRFCSSLLEQNTVGIAPSTEVDLGQQGQQGAKHRVQVLGQNIV